VSSRTWTPRAVGSESSRFEGDAWRAVEAQHVASTMALVDTLDEQRVLEEVLEAGKPAVPAAAARLDYLLATPFRYRPPPGGSRFRGDNDPGVFYAADAIRTACAELGYWRWRHLTDSPDLAAMPTKPQTVFRVKIAASTVDLREPPFLTGRARWTDPADYGECQAFGRAAREAGVQAIRYESVRDPKRGGCCALLTPDAFAARRHADPQTWWLSVLRDRVVWQRSGSSSGESFEFLAGGWTRPRPVGAKKTPAARSRRRRAT
jgi:hypothetical protein